jgi:hypothetical protein
MIVLFQGPGAGGFELKEQVFSADEWAKVKGTAVKLLIKRGETRAAELLTQYPFQLYEGTNYFGDDFSVMYFPVSLDDYVQFEDYRRNPGDRQAFVNIAKTIAEISHYVRFIAVELSSDATVAPVPAPRPDITTEVIERALLDAENLIHSSGPVSAVDRVHTAIHGYLRAVCQLSGISTTPDADLPRLFKLIREQHPAFNVADPHGSHILQTLRGIATILDALSPLRNRGSMAHPNPALLGEAEAMLAVNCGRTLLHYLDAKLRGQLST